MRIERNIPTLRELSLEKMRDAILGLHFRPGERLVERELGESLGVSRTVVREVLRHLEAEGLVQILQNKGPIVSKPTIEEAVQIYELRGMLEAMAARACAENPRASTIAALDHALADIKKGYSAQVFDGALLKATTRFYEALFQAAGKPVAWQIVSLLNARISHLRAITTRSPGRAAAGPAAMSLIVDAIRAGAPDQAAQACRHHVETASRIAIDYLSTMAGREEQLPQRGRGRRPKHAAPRAPQI